MKKIALLCAVCLLLTIIPSAVSAGNVSVAVTNVTEDILTVSGDAPNDSIVTVMILNPGKSVADVTSSAFSAVQYLGSVYSKAGRFTCDIKMNTGAEGNKVEGAFTVLVTIDGKLSYTDNNFIFYSNDTKLGYVNDLKNGTEEELLSADGDVSKIEKIFETYSLTNHELYTEANIEDLVDVIVNQNSRDEIEIPSDIDVFLTKVLVLNAFANKSDSLYSGNDFKYTEVWASDADGVSSLYSENFVNDLSEEGKSAVISETIDKGYSNAQFGDVFKAFKESMLLNIIVNNASMGSGHVERLVAGEFADDYEAAGFDVELLRELSGKSGVVTKLNKVVNCGAKTLKSLASKFNDIMSGKSSTTSSGGSGGSGGGSSSSRPTAGGGAEQYVVDNPPETAEPTVTEAPVPTEAPVVSAKHPFKDLSEALWANEAVEYLYENKIVNGRTETEYVPSATVTRAELVKMIVEALKVEASENEVAFSDVNESDWFASYVNKAASAGIVNGNNGAFNPNGGVTREDAALIIFRALGLENSGEITFSDSSDISDYAKDAIAAMVNNGFVSGMGDGTFAPKATLTRAQAAQLIYNALTKGGNAQ